MHNSNYKKPEDDATKEQRSNGGRNRCKLLRLLIKIAVTVLACTLVISALNYIATPALSYTRIQFHDLYTEYGKNGKNMDLLFIGTSHAYRSFDTEVFEDVLDVETYNFVTSGQTICGSYYLLKEILKTNHPNKVVFELTYTCFRDKEQNPIQGVILSQYMKPSLNKWDYIFHEMGVENAVYSIVPAYAYRENLMKKPVLSSFLRDKASEEYINYDLKCTKSDYEWMEKKGFVYTNKVLPKREIGKMDPEGWDETLLNPVYIDYLYRIIDLCDEKNIELVFVTAPSPKAALLELGNYDEVCEYFNKIAQKKHIPYYNFNLLKPNVLSFEDEDFFDTTHLNGEGAKKLSRLLAGIFKKKKKDNLILSDYFYKTWGEQKQNVDYITNVFMTVKADDENYSLTAHAFSGLDDPEYEYSFYAYDAEGQNRKLLRDWSTEPLFELPLNYASEGQKWKVQVVARLSGSDATIDESQCHILDFPYEFPEEELVDN